MITIQLLATSSGNSRFPDYPHRNGKVISFHRREYSSISDYPSWIRQMAQNENKQPSEVELEVLFNAVVSKTDDINQLFKS